MNPITEPELSTLQKLLNAKPFLINNDINRVVEYVNQIDRYANEEKGEDLGRCVVIMSQIQGRQVDPTIFQDINDLSAEANNRAIAHVLYLRHVHGLDFINGNEDLQVLQSNLIDGAVEILQGTSEELSILDAGIKMVEYIAANILD